MHGKSRTAVAVSGIGEHRCKSCRDRTIRHMQEIDVTAIDYHVVHAALIDAGNVEARSAPPVVVPNRDVVIRPRGNDARRARHRDARAASPVVRTSEDEAKAWTETENNRTVADLDTIA